MLELTDNICKNCTAPLTSEDETGGVWTCRYCGNKFTLPKEKSSPAMLAFLRSGEQYLDTKHFSEAYTMFERAAEEDPTEPEAYFGMALSKAQVQYLRDYRANGKDFSTDFRMQPICYEISEKKFTEDKNYLKAIGLATPEQKTVYREKAEEIDRIRAEFSKLKKSGLTYDCFLCVKVSREDGSGHTEDALLATRLYHSLKDAGYHPFYSEEEMMNRSGAEYEAFILYALYSASCMLVICTDEDYLRTPWVKNEYTRYIKMLSEEEKQHESITIAFQGDPIEKLPGLSGKIQGIDLRNFDGLTRILHFVGRFAAKKKAAPEIKSEVRSETPEAPAPQKSEPRKSEPVQSGRGANTDADTASSRPQPPMLSDARKADFSIWFHNQTKILQILLLLIPFVGWIVEMLVRWCNYTRDKSAVNLFMAFFITLFGFCWTLTILDGIVLAVSNKLFLEQ